MIKKTLFSRFSYFCKNIENVSSRISKTELLLNFFKEISALELKISIYFFQNSLGPIFNTKTTGISTSLIEKWISNYLYIDEKEIKNLLKIYGDLGLVLNSKKKEFEKKEDLFLLKQVWDNLILISEENGKNSQNRKMEIFLDVLKNIDAESSIYFIRILEGNFRIGISDKTIIDALSDLIEEKIKINYFNQIERAFSIFPDLAFIGEKIKNTERDFLWIDEIKVKIGVPVFLQAAERLKNLNEISFEKINYYLVQPKYDGLRLQLHFDGENVFAFSRNLLPMNSMFPEIEKEFKSICEKKNIKNIICDGEILVYNSEKKIYASFQETIERRRKYEIDKYENTHPIHYIIFDIIYLNNECLIDYKYEERLNLIENIFKKENDSIVYKADTYNLNNSNDINLKFEYYKLLNYEGIMIKNPFSKYQPGKRNKDWIKWKNIQKGLINDTIDVVIIGFFYGKGKKLKNGIGAILTAIYNSENETFESIAKIGTGLSEEKWIELKDNILKFVTIEKPANVNIKKIIPDEWCLPKFIVSIETDSISKSDDYFCGYSFRFPRLKNIVGDKNLNQITSKIELITLLKN